MSSIKITKESEENSPIDNSLLTIYLIKFPDGKEIRSKVSKRLYEDLINFGIIPETATSEEKQSLFEAYIINGALKFVESNLHTQKQTPQGKIDSSEGSMEDEF